MTFSEITSSNLGYITRIVYCILSMKTRRGMICVRNTAKLHEIVDMYKTTPCHQTLTTISIVHAVCKKNQIRMQNNQRLS